MTASLLWYLLAGVLVGFAASTLWEWLYFRTKRMKLHDGRVRELEAQLAEEREINAQMRRAQDATRNQPPDYASPGVFLDSEEQPVNTARAETTRVDVAPAPAPVEPQTNASLARQSVAQDSPPANSDGPAQSTRQAAVAPAVVASEAARARQDEGAELGATAQPVTTSDANRSAGRYVDALAEVDDDEDDGSTLERLAAELAQGPRQVPAPVAQPMRATPPPRSKEHPDNLSLIKGIGDVYKFRLYAAGIFTWHQLAETDIETLRVATHAYPGSNVDEWGEQASALAEKYGREGANYTGPVPDDLTQIIGIGPVGERTLFRAGICTYSQLAGATVAELQSLFPVAIAGDEPDFNQWIRLAIDLANRKGKE